jgi:hypothetical protein
MERVGEALHEFEWVLGHSAGTREARSALEEIQAIRPILKIGDRRESRTDVP